jgi:molecular chaperone HtpG
MKEGQKAIYYQIAPSRSAIENGPYLEAFKSKGYEVLFLNEAIDDYVVNSLGEFDGKDLQAVNSSEVDLGDASPEGETLSQEDTDKLCTWIKESLGARVQEVRAGKRLISSPAMAVQAEGEMSPQMRQMMKALKKDDFGAAQVILEVNPSNAIVRKLSAATTANPELAGLIAQQLLDNALMSAGLLEDAQTMIGRVQRIMEQALA